MNVYNYACTGLFEKHKLCFSFQMCIKLQQDSGLVPQTQLDFFLKGNIALEKVKKAKPADWISDQAWQDIVKLGELCSEFATLPEDIGKLQD